MSDELEALDDLIKDILGDHCTQDRLTEFEGGLDETLWGVLAESGLTRLGIPEEAGGSGGSLAEVAVVLARAGASSAQVPIAEAVVAGMTLAAAGLPLPDGVLTVGVGDVSATRSAAGWQLSGRMPRVAYARCAEAVVGLARSPEGPVVFCAPVEGATISEGANLANEPRDDVTLDLELPDESATPADLEAALSVRGSLTRALMIGGAAQNALELTVQYTGERVQFGRRIAAFQAVQQQVALAAAEVAATRAAVQAAVVACDHDATSAGARLAVYAGKARAGEAAGAVATVAHQVHGAIGMTHEHILRFNTTRLWSWRDEWGRELDCARHVAAAAVAVGPEGLWPMLVGV